MAARSRAAARGALGRKFGDPREERDSDEGSTHRKKTGGNIFNHPAPPAIPLTHAARRARHTRATSPNLAPAR
eukprot:scaffold111981_cov75-Phaeocystis_antarctica.AAC.1